MVQIEEMFFNKPVILLLLILMTTTKGFLQEARLTRREINQKENRVSLDRQLENSQNLPIRNSDINRQITQKDENTERLYDRRSFRTGTIDKFISRNVGTDVNNNRLAGQQDSQSDRRNVRILGERRQQREEQRYRDERRDIRTISRAVNGNNQQFRRETITRSGDEFRSSERVNGNNQYSFRRETTRRSGDETRSERTFGRSVDRSIGPQDQSDRRVIVDRTSRLPVQYRSKESRRLSENFQSRTSPRKEHTSSEYPTVLSSTKRYVQSRSFEKQPNRERYAEQRERNYPPSEDRRIGGLRDKSAVQGQYYRYVRSPSMSREHSTRYVENVETVSKDRRERIDLRENVFRLGNDRRSLETRCDKRSNERLNLIPDRVSTTGMSLDDHNREISSNLLNKKIDIDRASGSRTYFKNVLSERKAGMLNRYLSNFRVVADVTNMKLNDSNSWANIIKTILAAFLIGQILVSSSKANKFRFYNTMTSLVGSSKPKVQ